MKFLDRTGELDRLDAMASREAGMTLVEMSWDSHVASVFEDLCRRHVATCEPGTTFAAPGPWLPAARWW